jgi:hypothetical protein
MKVSNQLETHSPQTRNRKPCTRNPTDLDPNNWLEIFKCLFLSTQCKLIQEKPCRKLGMEWPCLSPVELICLNFLYEGFEYIYIYMGVCEASPL